MTSRIGDTLTWVSALLDTATAATALATWQPCRPVRLRRWGYVWGVVAADPEAFAMELDKRVLLGDDTGRVKLSDIAGVAGETVGKGAYTRVGAAGGGDIDIDADEELVIELPAAGDTTDGDAYVFIEYEALPFVSLAAIGANLTDRDA